MLTTKMSTLNNTSHKDLHPLNTVSTDEHHSPSNLIQLPPLSYLLGKKSPSVSQIPTFKTNRSISFPEGTPTRRTSSAETSTFASKSAPASRLPSISDILPQQDVKTPVKEPIAKPVSTEKKAYAFISHSPLTFPSHEPSIDNAQLARRKRRRTSPNELSILQQEFEIGHTPNKARRQEIASKVSMTEKAVQIWFQNKRQAIRKLQLSDQSIHQTTTITLPEVDVITSPTTSTPIKFFDGMNKVDNFATSPISASSTSSNELPLPISKPVVDLKSSPPAHLPQQALHHLPPPRPATWTMVTPAKLNPVTPVRNSYSNSQHHQLPTPHIVSFRLNKMENTKSTTISSNTHNNILPPTPSSSAKFSHKKPLMKVQPLDCPTKSPSPADTKVKSMMSLTNLNSPSLESSKKRKILGDITNSENKRSKKEPKKEGEIECVENLLALRSSNWK